MMDEARLWKLVEEARAEMTPELSNQPDILQKKLSALPPTEIVAFERIFTKLVNDAYRWDLWAATYIIEGGCSDDGLLDFRGGLIGFGREVYYAAVADPSTLVRLPTRGVDFSKRGHAVRGEERHEAVTGEELPESDIPHPAEPVGEPWDEDSVEEKYPELAAKFRYG